MSHRPRKRFGQHFLHDPNVIQNIITAIHPAPGEQLVEIGPGQGALTYALLKYIPKLEVVEIDRDLIAELQQQAGTQLTIHNQDALKFDFCSLRRDNATKLRVVGNLPYNISTPLMFHLMDQIHCISDMHFMLQKEVVDRMVAAPGDDAYGRLSIMLQFYCELTHLFDVGAGAFYPPPKVESAVVRLVPHQQPPVECDVIVLRTVVTQAFTQRRKTLRNAVKNLLDANQIHACNIDPGRRPETLSLSEFACLARTLASIR